MTSSDLTLLPADAKQRAAARVGTRPSTALTGADRRRIRVGLACAEFNGGITDRLLTGALDALEESGCDLDTAIVAWAPGAFELPVVAQQLARSGAGRRGDLPRARSSGATPATTTSWPASAPSGLQRVQLDTGVPIVFGVLTTDTVDQALERSEERRGQQGPGGGGRRPSDTVSVLGSVSAVGSGRSGSGSPSAGADAAPGPAQGLARTGHPGAVRRRRPGCEAGPRPSTTGRPSTTRGSTRSGSCGPRRSRSTWPTGCSTSGSPVGTGWRSGGAT